MEKLLLLMALATAHRVQTFSLINIENIEFLQSSVEINIPELIKTSAPEKYQPLLILPFLEEKPELCVRNTVEYYLQFTTNKINTK